MKLAFVYAGQGSQHVGMGEVQDSQAVLAETEAKWG